MGLLAATAVGACGGGDGGDGDDGGSAAEAAANETPTLQGVQRTPPLAVGAVTLPDAANAGEDLTMRARPGALLLVYFGYTMCPDICPTTMSDIAVALRKIDAAADVDVAMVTVDPARDTDEVLSEYMGHFFPNSGHHALRTEDEALLASAKEAFGVQSEIEEHAPGTDDYEVAHTAVTYVVDEAGNVVVEWPFGISSDVMASDLGILLEEAA